MLDPLAVLNAVMAGGLLGGFYASVALGIAIAFGMLDIPNLSHPAFVVVGAFATWQLNSQLGLDPVLAGLVMAPPFFVLGAVLYRLYHVCFATDTGFGSVIFSREGIPQGEGGRTSLRAIDQRRHRKIQRRHW